MIQKVINALTKEESNNAKKYNILNILNNVGAIFTGISLHYKDAPKETLFERSIAKRITLKKQRTSKIKRKEENIKHGFFREYFTNYQIPSDMYEKLRETEGAVNEHQVDLIKKILAKMKKKNIENVPKKTFKTEKNEKIIDIIERILEFNNKNQLGQGLKILTPN